MQQAFAWQLYYTGGMGVRTLTTHDRQGIAEGLGFAEIVCDITACGGSTLQGTLSENHIGCSIQCSIRKDARSANAIHTSYRELWLHVIKEMDATIFCRRAGV